MRCKTETEIERAAIHLLQTGWPTEAGIENAPEQLQNFLRHTNECVRCREVLDVFLQTEKRLRTSLAADPGSDAPPKEAEIILALRPLFETRERPARETGGFPSDLRGPAEDLPDSYDLAADTGTPVDDQIPPQERTLTLDTDDDRNLVRILATGSGSARAVLVRFPSDAPAEETELHPFLRIGGVEYSFDQSTTVELPRFPGEPVALVFR